MAEYDDEPDCTCQQTDVDQFDARGCEYHDPASEWNRRQRAAELAKLAELAKVEAREVYRPAPEDVEYEYGRDMGWW